MGTPIIGLVVTVVTVVRVAGAIRSEELYHVVTSRCIDSIQRFGFLEDRDGVLFVPELLRGVVAQAIIVSYMYLESIEHEFGTIEL